MQGFASSLDSHCPPKYLECSRTCVHMGSDGSGLGWGVWDGGGSRRLQSAVFCGAKNKPIEVFHVRSGMKIRKYKLRFACNKINVQKIMLVVSLKS